ncbi:MAG: Holliday junction resolvase RuvX [Terrimicrobiaceae bacterium]|jgi:putative Holliday junction resolvase
MKKVLGIDLGEARVGVAASDDLGMLAHPLETIDARATDPAKRIVELAAGCGASTIVVGIPRNMDGSRGPAAEKAMAFIEGLKKTTTVCVVGWDERLTTVSAQRALREAGRDARSQKSIIDQVAAQMILQGWLDANP